MMMRKIFANAYLSDLGQAQEGCEDADFECWLCDKRHRFIPLGRKAK